MKRYNYSLAIVFIAALLTATAGVAADKPDFSGQWKLNVAKSDFGPMPAPTSSVSKIEHKDPVFKVSTTTVSERGERTMEATYSTDGKVTENKTFGDRVSKSTATWDGPTLNVETKADFNGNEMVIKSKWTVSDDGKTLTMVQTFDTPDGKATSKRLLEKQ